MTLIEALIVVAIIGVLMALALPAFSLARQAARRSMCSASLHGFGVAFTLYRDQNRGNLPFANETYSVPAGWLEPIASLEPFLDVDPPSLNDQGQVVTRAPFLCPSDDSFGPTHGMSYIYAPFVFMQVVPPPGTVEYVTRMFDSDPASPLLSEQSAWHAGSRPRERLGGRNTLRIDCAVMTSLPPPQVAARATIR